jgi:hypothetical protein
MVQWRRGAEHVEYEMVTGEGEADREDGERVKERVETEDESKGDDLSIPINPASAR